MKLIIAMTGASGSLYGIRLMNELAVRGTELHLIFSPAGEQVLAHETGQTPQTLTGMLRQGRDSSDAGIRVYGNDDLFAPPASGSFRSDGMIIIPCSMASLAGIAHGTLGSLIGRAAGVTLKEKRSLIVVPRETPYSRVHLKAMLELDAAGGMIIPASPAFYNHPHSIEELVDSVVGRILDTLDIEHNLFTPWGEQHEQP